MIRIVIADDHEIVRRGLVQIVADVPDMVVSGEAANAPELLDLVRRQPCDVVVLDIKMPGQSGLEALKALKAEHPRLPVLILSTHSEEEYAVRVLRAGAAGFLSKQGAPRELVAAIRKVCEGRKFISASAAEKLAWALDEESDRPLHEGLSDREYEVMCLIASGKTLKEIASELSLSDKTLSTYRSRILEKMRMRRNVDLVRYSLLHRLIE